MNRFLRNERGMALFIVLWVMALLTVIAGEFCYAVRTEANITRNFKEETQSYYIAVSGLSWAIEGLVADDSVPASLKSNADDKAKGLENIRRRINIDIPPIPYGDGQFKVEKENESGKVNLNRADESLLLMMLSRFEIADAEKNIIVDSIMDWRDEDDLHRVSGAENEYYLSLPKPYKCKNGDFTSVDELLFVRGVTPEIFYGGLKDIVAVYPHHKTGTERDIRRRTEYDYKRININAAPSQTLRAFPLMTEKAVQDIMKYREKRDFQSFADLQPIVGAAIYDAIWPFVTFNLSPYYKIRSVGMLKEGQTRRGLQAVVKIDKTIAKGYEVIQWIDAVDY
jgi:general secretion pathway protein K